MMQRRSLLKLIAAVPLAGLAAAQTYLSGSEDRLELAGEWAFRLDPENRGVRERWYGGTLPSRIRLPENRELPHIMNRAAKLSKRLAAQLIELLAMFCILIWRIF